MNIEDFRAYCLSFKGAHDEFLFERASSEYDRNLLVFQVLDKWFCFVNVVLFDFCTIKCVPEEACELQDRYEGVRPGYHMNKKHWSSVYFHQDVPDSVIKELVRKSYELVVQSFTKKEREQLNNL